jgi:hypothetical protein
MTIKSIDFGKDRHTVVIGTTRFGKTEGAKRSLTKVQQGVFFFNTQQIVFGKGWTIADKSADMDLIVKVLKSGGKVNYVPDRDYREQELVIIIHALFKASERSLLDIYFVLDEAHLFKQKALQSAEELATTGLRWGLKGVFITQRPQLLSKTLWSQSTYFVFYKTHNQKESYYNDYGIPYADMNDRIPEKYFYSTFDGEKVEGAYKV